MMLCAHAIGGAGAWHTVHTSQGIQIRYHASSRDTYRSSSKYCITGTYLLDLEGVIVGDVGPVKCLQQYNAWFCYGRTVVSYGHRGCVHGKC